MQPSRLYREDVDLVLGYRAAIERLQQERTDRPSGLAAALSVRQRLTNGASRQLAHRPSLRVIEGGRI